MSFLALITRCKDEPFLNEFVQYYLSQGVDKIYLLDDDSKEDPHLYKEVLLNPAVEVIFDFRITQMSNEFDGCKTIYQRIKDLYEWIIVVDVDEFITTKRLLSNTIRDELLTTFKEAHCVKVPWVMMSCNSIVETPESLLQTNIYRWNHDLRHTNLRSKEHKFRCRYDSIEVKCIFRSRCFKDIFMHHPLQPLKSDIRIVESIRNRAHPLDPFYPQLREVDIREGFLLCYHYRIVSIQNCCHKIKHHLWYQRYQLEDLLSNDYPEIVDETLKHKSLDVVLFKDG